MRFFVIDAAVAAPVHRCIRCLAAPGPPVQDVCMLDYRTRAGGPRQIIILHGFGASSADLYPLADEMDPTGRFTWHFPQAPYPISYGGSTIGRAWFPRNEDEMRGAVEGIYFHRLEHMDPDGLRQAGSEVLELARYLGADPDALVLGGFSQGAMVAVEAFVQAGRPPADLLLYSGSVIAADRWRERLAGMPAFGFFQSHGTADPVLPFAGAMRLFSLLEEIGTRRPRLA